LSVKPLPDKIQAATGNRNSGVLKSLTLTRSEKKVRI
jgi:hypothetical protein